MEATTRFRDWLDRLLESELRAAISLIAVAIAALALGYAGGSVLAGDSITEQFWLLPVFTGVLASLLALSAREE